jgi:serine O-acetyltransferase
MFENLRADFARAREDRPDMLVKEGLAGSVFLSNLRILLEMTTWTIVTYRYSRAIKKVRIPILRQSLEGIAWILQAWTELCTGVFIDSNAEIGPGLVIHTPYGICIGPAKIGKNCTVGMGVVISGASGGIGDNVFFGPGAKIVGTAKIGNNVVVVANSLILTDVADNLTVLGVPARFRLPGGVPGRFQKPKHAASAAGGQS